MMINFKKAISLVLVASMALSMAACGAKEPAAPAESGAAAPEATSTSMYPGTPNPKEIVMNLASEPPKLNSLITTDSTSSIVLVHTMDGLTKLDENSNPQPAIAEKWTQSEDGLTYTFNLRKDAKWSNGEPVTAKDFVFAWTTLLTPATAAEYAYMGYIFKNGESFYNGKCKIEEVGFKAIDDYTLEVVLQNPLPYLLGQLAYKTFLPVNEKAYNEIGGDKYATEAEYFVTNGGYKMESWTHEDNIVLVKNPDYYNAANVDIEKIKMLMISDSNTAMNGFKTGDIDMIGLSGDQPAMLKAEGYPIQGYADGSCWYFEFNTADKRLNAKIRQALTMAVDVESLIKNVLKNESTVAYSFTPECISGADGKPFAQAVGKLVERDAAKAKTLFEEGLKEAGITAKDLDGITFLTDEGDNAARMTTFVQEQWKKNLGFTCEVQQMPFKSRLDRMSNKDFGIVLAGWSPDYNDPMTFLDLWVSDGGNNHTGYKNPAYDKLIDDAKTEIDPMKRQAMFVEAEKIIATDAPIGLIYNRVRNFVCSEKLSGVVRTPFIDTSLMMAKSK
ncbi:MAG: peptide ABC transporter substrate-binding protein [Oscillospiraceae bacterium]